MSSFRVKKGDGEKTVRWRARVMEVEGVNFAKEKHGGKHDQVGVMDFASWVSEGRSGMVLDVSFWGDNLWCQLCHDGVLQ